jgi:hypothetical protein
VGDAFYSRLNVTYPFIKNSHTGIYFRYRGDDPNDKRNHLVIDHPGLGYPVMIRSLYDASDGGIGYWGAYNPGAYGKIGFQDRMKVLRTAIELVRTDPPIPYVFFDALFVPDELKPLWTGETMFGEMIWILLGAKSQKMPPITKITNGGATAMNFLTAKQLIPQRT